LESTWLLVGEGRNTALLKFLFFLKHLVHGVERHELTSRDVKRLVFEAIGLIKEVRGEFRLPIFSGVEETGQRLFKGVFRAEEIPFERRVNSFYALNYSYFEPPSTISLDRRRPFWDNSLDLPELVETATYYCAVHEVIHADNYREGNRVVEETMRHISEEHQDKLKTSIRLLKRSHAPSFIASKECLTRLWAEQYDDMVTHYKTYLILRQKRFPKLDYLWDCLYTDFFPPNLLTAIECEKGVDYVLKCVTEKVGQYCLVEALDEVEEIGKKRAEKYAV